MPSQYTLLSCLAKGAGPWKRLQRASHTFMLLPLPRHLPVPNVTKRSSDELRRLFVAYFEELAAQNHVFIPPSSLIAKRDEGSYFVNAGMNQFKSVFLGGPLPEVNGASVHAAVNSQRCIRIGGKHNDLDDVGWDAHHHSSFEMLGNWSFDSYGRAEMCSIMWHFLTRMIGLPREQLYMTVFSGCRNLSLPADVETRDAWLRLGIPDSKLLSCGPEHNLWLMGNKGVGGVCTEVHFDWFGAGGRCARCFVNSGSPEVVELWNSVFISLDLLPSGHVQPLGKTFVDTGMGLERLTAIVQGVTSNYDTDLFAPIIQEISSSVGQNSAGLRYTGVPPVMWPPAHHSPGQKHPSEGSSSPCSLQLVSALKDGEVPREGSVGFSERQVLSDVSHRVVADHLRTLWLACNEGLLPHRQGVGLKVRHLLHRMLLHASVGLGLSVDQLVDRVLPVVHRLMLDTTWEGSAMWPMLELRLATIIRNEANLFLPHFDECLTAFGNISSTLHFGDILQASHVREMLAASAHLNLDLIGALARRRGLQMSREALDVSAPISSPSSIQSTTPSPGDEPLHQMQLVNTLRSRGVPPTNVEDKYNYHIRRDANTEDPMDIYVLPPSHAQVLAILDATNERPLRKANFGQRVLLCFDRTNFYTESGGQLSDLGVVTRLQGHKTASSAEEEEEEVMKVMRMFSLGLNQHENKEVYVLHEGTVSSQMGVRVGDSVHLHVDVARRVSLMQHHTATHVLQWALHSHLHNDSPLQQGSLVAPDTLSFQFSSLTSLDRDLLQKVEDSCQDVIHAAKPITATCMTLLAAHKMGAVYLKDHEYPHQVRVVMLEGQESGSTHSLEVCGGTHLLNTAHLQRVLITGCARTNQSVKAISAVAGHKAVQVWKRGVQLLELVKDIEAATKDSLWEKANDLLQHLEKEVKGELLGYLHRHSLNEALVRLRYPILSHVVEQRRKEASESRMKVLLPLAKLREGQDCPRIIQMDLSDENGVALDLCQCSPPQPVLFVDKNKGLLVVPKCFSRSAIEVARQLSDDLKVAGKPVFVKPIKVSGEKDRVAVVKCAVGGDLQEAVGSILENVLRCDNSELYEDKRGSQ